MRILVTGGAGFIASNVADGFIRDGHEVAVLDNLSTGQRENIPAAARFYEGDIRDGEFVKRVFDEFRPEAVNHHAAQMDVRRSLLDPFFDAECNIIGSLRLILESVRIGTKRFIYASTGGAVFGELEKLPADELQPVNPECAYGISKHTVEHYLELYRLLEGLNYVVLRYGNVYGPRQNPHGEAGVNAIFIGMMLDGKTPTIYGDGEQLRDYVFIGDVVRANMAALTRGDNQIFNIGTGTGISVNQLYTELKTILGFPYDAHYADARQGEIRRIFLDSTKARTKLDWTAEVKFSDGLRRTVEWFESKRETVSV